MKEKYWMLLQKGLEKMKHKRYIRTTPLEPVLTKSNVKTPEQQDKIARIYAMAERLHVKIGGKE